MLLLDAPARVGGRNAFRDHLDPRTYHVLPAPPHIRAAALGARFWLSVEAHPEADRPSAAGLKVVPLALEEAEIALIRFEARRRKGQPDVGPVVTARRLVAAPVPLSGSGGVELESAILETDRAEVERALRREPSRLAVVTRLTLRGLEPPRDLVLRVEPQRARSVVATGWPPGAVALGDQGEGWLTRLLEAGAAKVEPSGAVDDPLARAYLSRWVEGMLFEPEASPEVVGLEALDDDPDLRRAWEEGQRAVLGRRLRPEASLPEEPVTFDGRRGLVRTEEVVLSSPLLPPSDAPRVAVPPEGSLSLGVHPDASWAGVEAVEVEFRGVSGPIQRVVLSEEAPHTQIPGGLESSVRARARLPSGSPEARLETPEWTEWRPADRRTRWDPQRLAGRRLVQVGFGWVGPARITAADVVLVGREGEASLRLDGAKPEAAHPCIGSVRRLEVGIHAKEHGVLEGSVELSDRARFVAVESPVSLPAPVVVRLSDPTARYAELKVELETFNGGGRRLFRLSRAAPEAVWSPPAEKDEPGYRYRVEARYEDGRIRGLPWRPGSSGVLVLGDPDVELRTVEVLVAKGAAESAWLVIEAEEAPTGVASAVEVFVPSGAIATVELPFRVGAPFAYRLFGERYDGNGGSITIAPEVVRARRWILRGPRLL